MLDLMKTGNHCDAVLYAQELSHRTANLLQQAISALHLAGRGDTRHMNLAIDRLTGAGDLQRMLGDTGSGCVDLTGTLLAVCQAVGRMTGTDDAVSLVVEGDPLLVHGQAARRMSMIVAELVGNSIRHGLRQGPGSIVVAMRDDGVHTTIVVEDDGVVGGWSRPGGQGRGIVDALAAGIGGHVRRDATAGGSSRVEVTVPSIAAAAAVPPFGAA